MRFPLENANAFLARKIIKSSYSISGSYFSKDVLDLEYILKIGDLWKGKIGKAVIRINGINALSVINISPKGYEIKDRAIVWNFKELDPKSNIKIQYASQLSVWIDSAEIALNKKDILDGICLVWLERKWGFLANLINP